MLTVADRRGPIPGSKTMVSGLDRLLADPGALEGRRYGLLAHHAAVTVDLEPAHLALTAAGNPPAVIFGPEHGYYSVEQDMIAAEDLEDPLTERPIRSLYGDTEASLRPRATAFDGLDLLVIDLQDIGSRYYTYAATAVWAAEVALAAGCEVWVLDRPNPLGGLVVEGNLRAAGFGSFVGAFETPVRHGLTLGELLPWALATAAGGSRLETAGLRVWSVDGWAREQSWPVVGRPFVAPSPNMPTYEIALLYPGLCLVEGTTVSEGRGTTRPFQLVGAPWIDAASLARALDGWSGVRSIPTYFRPQFQKHADEVCSGIELHVTEPAALRPYRFGLALIEALWHQAVQAGVDLWRRQAYEFVTDRPAIDLLFGTDLVRRALESGDPAAIEAWTETWTEDEERFRRATEPYRLYE